MSTTGDQASIIVIGAGELGTALIGALALHPACGENKIGVILRHSTITSEDPAEKDRNQRLLSLNCFFEASDIEKDGADKLAAVFNNDDTVIGCSGMEGSSGIQAKLTQDAVAAGVNCYIPWQFGVDYDVLERESSQDLFDEQLDVRTALRAQDTIDVLSADQKTVRALGNLENAVTVTDVEVIGKMTTEIVWNGDGIKNEVIFNAGDTIKYGDLARILEESQDSLIEKIEWAVPSLKESLTKDPGNGIKKYRIVFAEGEGVSCDISKTLNARRGIELKSVQQWVTK